MSNKTLRPLIGVGDVRFGMTADEVKKILGRPSEEVQNESFGDEDDDLMTTLYYDEFGLSLSFDKSVDYRLIDIMTEDGSPFEMEQGFRPGMTIEEARRVAQAADMGPMEEVDIEEEMAEEDNGEALAAYDLTEQGLTLWFRDGLLDTIQLGPEYDENDNIVWPCNK